VFLILSGRYQLDRFPLGHPLIADLGQQVNIEFVGKQQNFSFSQGFSWMWRMQASFSIRSGSSSWATTWARFHIQPSRCSQRRSVEAETSSPRWILS
jgi:hypothetical protein